MKKYLTCFFKELGVFTSYMFPFVFSTLFLGALIIPGHRVARSRSWERACFANQKTIMGALEMYNLDHYNNTETQLLINGREELQILVKERYLQKIPECPVPEKKKILPSRHELYAISYLSVPAGIYTFNSSLVKAAGRAIKQSLYPEAKIPHEYRSDSCGNVWCTIHGPVSGECLPCSDGRCEKARRAALKAKK